MNTVALETGAPVAVRSGTRQWRTVGILVLVHIALLFSAIAFEPMVDPGDTPAQVARAYATANPATAHLGVMLEATSFLVFGAAAAVVFRLFAVRSDVARHAATVFLVLAGVYVASTIAVGFAPEIAGIRAAHLGADPTAVAMVNDIRNVGFVLQTATFGAATLALGIASIAARIRVWWGWGAAIIGTLTVIATALDPNIPGQVTMLWWVVLAVASLVKPPRS